MVLNSFSVFPTNDIKKLNKCYRNAEFIISGSKIITKYIKFTFPKIKKIYQSTLSIDKNQMGSVFKVMFIKRQENNYKLGF